MFANDVPTPGLASFDSSAPQVPRLRKKDEKNWRVQASRRSSIDSISSLLIYW